MNSPPYSERIYRMPSTSRQRENFQQYRQATVGPSTITSISAPSTCASPGMTYQRESRHQARSTKPNEKPEPRMRRQLPCTIMLSNCINENREEIESVASTLDDFDYFCSISYSPSTKITPNYTAKSTQMRRQRLRGMKSHSMFHTNETTAGCVEDCTADKRALGRTLTTYNQDVMEGLNPKQKSENSSRNNSSANLSQGSKSAYSPARSPMAPQTLRHIPSGSGQSPLGAAISQEALEADDPHLVEFKVQVVGSPSVGKSTICQRLAKLNGVDNGDFNEDTEDELQTLSVKAILGGKVFNVGFVETVMYAAEDTMNIEIQECMDAFVVVYAIDDSSTFEFARRVLQAMRESIKTNSLLPAGFILVGNKSDLVRGREVLKDDANQFATSLKAKFIEVSAVLDHKIPDLLLNIITHLRELEEAKAQRPKRPPTNEMWGTSRKISVKMSASGGDAGGNGEGGAEVHGGLGVGASDASTRRSKKTTKKDISKFFKRHFSKSFAEESDMPPFSC